MATLGQLLGQPTETKSEGKKSKEVPSVSLTLGQLLGQPQSQPSSASASEKTKWDSQQPGQSANSNAKPGLQKEIKLAQEQLQKARELALKTPQIAVAPPGLVWRPGPPKPGDKVDDEIDIAAGHALFPIATLETDWTFDKLRWKIGAYFRSAGKDMEYKGPLLALLDDFADKAFGTIWGALCDRSWLRSANFRPIMDAAVKQLFPAPILRSASLSELETGITRAHDRALEEARFSPLMWDTIQTKVEGKANQKKVIKAFEKGRNVALTQTMFDHPGLEPMACWAKIEKFSNLWIQHTVIEVQKQSSGYELLPIATANEIFQFFFQNDSFPIGWENKALMAEGMSISNPWPYVDKAVKEAYQLYIKPIISATKRRKMADPFFKTELCWYFMYGTCTYGDDCSQAHGWGELKPMPASAMGGPADWIGAAAAAFAQVAKGGCWGKGENSFGGPWGPGLDTGWCGGEQAGQKGFPGCDFGKGMMGFKGEGGDFGKGCLPNCGDFGKGGPPNGGDFGKGCMLNGGDFGKGCLPNGGDFGKGCLLNGGDFGKGCLPNGGDFGKGCLLNGGDFGKGCLPNCGDFGKGGPPNGGDFGKGCQPMSFGGKGGPPMGGLPMGFNGKGCDFGKGPMVAP